MTERYAIHRRPAGATPGTLDGAEKLDTIEVPDGTALADVCREAIRRLPDVPSNELVIEAAP